MVGQHYLPEATQYALGGQRALQVWYRDTTLRWVRFEHVSAHREMPLVTIVEFQPRGGRWRRRATRTCWRCWSS
jgi:hypothetical protein